MRSSPKPDPDTLEAVRQLIDSESDFKVRMIRECYQHGTGHETELCRRYKSDLNSLVLLREKVNPQTIQEFMDMPVKYPPIVNRWFFDTVKTEMPHRD